LGVFTLELANPVQVVSWGGLGDRINAANTVGISNQEEHGKVHDGHGDSNAEDKG